MRLAKVTVPVRGAACTRTRTRTRARVVAALALTAFALVGCGAARSYRHGERAARDGQWEAAVEYYRRAVRDAPDRPEYRIALERAMRSAARFHAAEAAALVESGELSMALDAYRRSYALDPSNGQVAVLIANLQQTLREQLEASRPTAPIETLRAQARRDTPLPVLNPASDEPLNLEFIDASLRDVLDALGDAAGITVTYDEGFQDRSYTVTLSEVTFVQALDQMLTANNAFYKVISPTTVVVVPDTPQKRAAYEEQVIRTFYVSHANVEELLELLSAIVQIPQLPVQPQFMASVEANTITVRATAALAEVVERVIAAHDKPRAEIVIDVEILEVNRESARQYGLDLSRYALGAVFSPEAAPATSQPSTGTGETASPFAQGAAPFNLNTISRGVSPADFYAAVPAAVINFLEQDTRTRLVAKPQLRGQEGTELTLNLGQDIPVPATSFTPLAAGGAAFNPLTSYQYRPVGVVISMTPRVTYENEIVLELEVENSTVGPPILVAGQSLPTFGTRRVTTRLRLRDGESNLLAGLIRQEDRRTLRGLPGLLRLPVLRHLFGSNDTTVQETDIVMLLTPRIVRTRQLTLDDVRPLHIGTQRNIGVSGPPPLIAPPPVAEPAARLPAFPDAAAPVAPPPDSSDSLEDAESDPVAPAAGGQPGPDGPDP